MSNTFHNSQKRWSPITPDTYCDCCWLTPAAVALCAQSTISKCHKGLEPDLYNDMPVASGSSTVNSNVLSNTHENRRNSFSQEESTAHNNYLKTKSPSIGKRFKEKLRTGFVEGQIGKLVAEAAIHHDLADVPSMPEKALIGVNSDELHSRDSYISIVNTAIDHARRNLKPGERHVYNVKMNDELFYPSQLSAAQKDKSTALHTDGNLYDVHEDLRRPRIMHQNLQNHSLTSQMRNGRSQNPANELQLPKSEIVERHPTVLHPGQHPFIEKATKIDTRHEEPCKIDWRQPVYQPYKGASFHGHEASKPICQPRGHTFHAQTSSSGDMMHILDAKLVKPMPLSPISESEIFRDLSAGTRSKKRAYKERRSAVIFGMTDEKMERLKAAGQQREVGSFSVNDRDFVKEPVARLPATIPALEPLHIEISNDLPALNNMEPLEEILGKQKGYQSSGHRLEKAQISGRQYNPEAKTFYPGVEPMTTKPSGPILKVSSQPSRTLSQFHRENKKGKAAYPGRTKFVDTHLCH